MADEKEIAKLVFNIQDAEKQLDTLNAKFEKFNKDSKKIAEDYAKIQSKIALEDAKAKSKIEVQNNKTYNKLVELDAKREAIIEANMQKEILANSKKNKEIEADDKKTINKVKVIGETRLKNSEALAGKLKVIEEQRTSHAQKQVEIQVTNHKKQMDSVEAYAQKKAIAEEYRQKHLAESQKSVWDKMSNMANTYLVTRGLNELRQAAGQMVTEMADVEYRMVEIDRVLNDSSLDVDRYRDKLIQLAYDYGNSFENVSDVTLRLAQAGFDTNEALALTEKTLLALNTAELDATQATEDMVAVMSQWGLMTGDAKKEAEDYARIIDEVNIVADNFPITSEDLMEALKKTSSAFKLSNTSIEQTIATIVAAEKSSQRGGKAIGTALNSIVQKLRDTGKLASMEAMGLDIYTDSAKTEFKSVIDILEMLSDKMQQLKDEGKENTQEMQNLMEVFALYRRNVGTSLLGEMGDGGTYNQVMKLLGENGEGALGYSLQENEKHMKTAKAAMEQFNATLLQLKTAIWDNGLEDVFRGLLVLGNDVIKVITTLTKTFGTLPTAIGAVTLAFTTFQKQMKFQNIDGKIGLGGNFVKKIREAEGEIKKVLEPMKDFENSTVELSASMDDYVSKVGVANISTKGYISYLFKMKAAEMAAEAATIALNAALSMGLSLAITAVLKLFDNYIHKQEKIIEKSNDVIGKTNEEIQTLEKMTSAYEKYSELVGPLTKEQQEELVDTQKEITDYLIKNNKYTSEMVGNYELQLKVLKEITEEQAKQRREALKDKVEATEENQGFTFGVLTKGFVPATIGLEAVINKLDIKTQIELLEEFKEGLEESGNVTNKITGNDTIAYGWVEKKLAELKEQAQETDIAIGELNEDIISQSLGDFLDENDIQNIEDYKNALESINDIEKPDDFKGSIEEFHAMLQQAVENTFPQYSEAVEQVLTNSVATVDSFETLASKIEELSSHFDMATKAANEFNSEGAITASTFKNLVQNDLLQYLDIVNGKMVVTKQYFEEEANSAKEDAIATLQDRAAKEILNIVTADLNGTLQETKSAAETGKAGIDRIAVSVINAANDFLKGKNAADKFNNSLKALAGGKFSGDTSGISKNAQKQIANVTKELNREIKMVNSLASGVTKASKAAASGAGSAGKSATKTFEEQSAERVKTFKKEIDNLESLEKSWVNKYKKLELFSTNDLKFITHQRINRFNEYLNQINNLQGISEKDRAELVQEYSAKRQEAELEYFDLLKKQLDDQISDLKEANKKRIEEIKDTAQAQIDALKRVESENDRIKQKEEYERKRQELIYGNQGIEYWRQRTGRDAQLALQDAEEKLRDLDEDWEDKKKDWTLDDQIEQIEKARDAQVKAIEDAQEKQIEGWQAAYTAQVQLYAQTGQIIYDDSVINAGYLYNAYMDNFVNPLQLQLQNVIASLNTASAKATEVASKVGAGGGGSSGGGGGGSAAAVANNAANISGIKSANIMGVKVSVDLQKKSISLKPNAAIQAGLSAIKKVIGRFHGGGIVGSSTESLALLRPQEVVLTPEWAAGMNKLVRQINHGDYIGGNTTSIDVQGNLVNMEGIEIKDRKDVDYLKDTVIREVEKKLNVRK